jgi:hypothetical protein
VPEIEPEMHDRILRELQSAQRDIERLGDSMAHLTPQLAANALIECRAALEYQRDRDEVLIALRALEDALMPPHSSGTSPPVSRALQTIKRLRGELSA